MELKKRTPGPTRQFSSIIGPGVITGAADDDPSGITTYSVAGAQLGTGLLWMAVVTWPLMGCVQMMCARIGMVTGRGMAGAFGQKFPKPFIVALTLALLIANTINIGADLIGMADAGSMLTGLNSHFLVFFFAAGIAWATVRFRYEQIARVLKWLALSLFAYVITAFVAHPKWSDVARHTFAPSIPKGHQTWAMMVAILGTTISPYLFFWQASQEVEEEKCKGRLLISWRRGATPAELLNRKWDVAVGTFFSNLVMYFIILTCAITLHKHGLTQIESSRQAAEALKPLAGSFATALYALGIIGIGLLAIPTLSGSAAYGLAETFHWRQGLDENLRRARHFYAAVILSTAAGVTMDILRVNPIKALYWTAIINGLVAPFLLAAILLVASDRQLMAGQPSSRLSRFVVALTTVAMFAAAIGMFVF